MKKNCWNQLSAVVLGVLGFGTMVQAGTITGSAHDFTTQAWSGGRICIACHASHNTDVTETDAPLWHHAPTTQTYTLYNTSTMDTTTMQPDGLSRLCLSCHDGTVAVDNFGGIVGGTTFVEPKNNLGSTLNDDHPIGFVYDSQLALTDGSLHDPASTDVTIGAGAQQKSGKIADVILFNGRMECSSCHDVHNTFTADNGDGLVRISQSGSAICLTCHNK